MDVQRRSLDHRRRLGGVPGIGLDFRETAMTPGMAKRTAPGPFAAAPIMQGKWNGTGTGDILSFVRGAQVATHFYANFDGYQWSVMGWWTPEHSKDDRTDKAYLFYASAAHYLAYDFGNDRFELCVGGQTMTAAYNAVAGTMVNIAAGGDSQNKLDGTNYGRISINDAHTFGITTQPTASAPDATCYVGSNNGANAAGGIIEGFVACRVIPWDGTYGANLWSGQDIINLVWAAGVGADWAQIMGGSWHDTLGLPTNSAVGALVTGEGEAWSHPHGDNLLTDGFCQTIPYESSGWADDGTPLDVTADNGATWAEVYDSPETYLRSIATDGAGVWCAGSGADGKIYRSADNGATWGEVYDSPESYIYSMATDGAGVWCAGSYPGGKIYRSADNGATWAEIYDSPETYFFSIATDGAGVWCAGSAASGKIYRSVDNGATWGEVYDSPETYILSMATDGAGVWCAGSGADGKIYRSADNAHCTSANDIRLRIWDDTNGAQIGADFDFGASSTRQAPGVALITFELPTIARNGVAADCVAVSIKVLSTAAQTIYLHQVELLPNLVDNPSLETGAGNPWIPDGWTNGTLQAGHSTQDVGTVHSGAASIALAGAAANRFFYFGAWPSEGFCSAGIWAYGSAAATDDASLGSGNTGQGTVQTTATETTRTQLDVPAAWTHFGGVWRSPGALFNVLARFVTIATGANLDDVYMVTLSSVSLTVTPASAANSAESGGVRVDGDDTLTQTIAGRVGRSVGQVSLAARPRHAPANMVAWLETTNVFWLSIYADANNYIQVRSAAANTLTLAANVAGAGEQTANWTCTGQWAADQKLSLAVRWLRTRIELLVDGAIVATITTPVTFSADLATVYYGSNSSGARQADIVFVEA